MANAPRPRMQQARARRTREVIVAAAARDFARFGFAGASVNSILESSGRTKGAMYSHFTSKDDLARAVLDAARDIYAEIGQRWRGTELHPLAALERVVADIASAFAAEPVVQAESRMSLEPEFYSNVARRGSRAWEDAGIELATRTHELGCFRTGFDPAAMIRMLAGMLAGQRYMAELAPDAATLRSRFAESYDTVVGAMITPECRRALTNSTT